MRVRSVPRLDRHIVKPFLLLSSRPEPELARAEYTSFLQHCGLAPDQLIQIRVDQQPLPELDLETYSGILVGGSPFNACVPESEKSEVQQRVEAEMSRLLDRLVPLDFPFFGACYGVATLGLHQGGILRAGERQVQDAAAIGGDLFEGEHEVVVVVVVVAAKGMVGMELDGDGSRYARATPVSRIVGKMGTIGSTSAQTWTSSGYSFSNRS